MEAPAPCVCTEELWVRYHADRSIDRRNAVVEANVGLVKSIARRQQRLLHREFDDLLQDGILCLVHIVPLYDCGIARFSTFATLSITRAMITGSRQEKTMIRTRGEDDRFVYNGADSILNLMLANGEPDWHFLDDILGKLTQKHRTVMEMRFMGYTCREIGVHFGISESAASRQVRYVIAAIRRSVR